MKKIYFVRHGESEGNVGSIQQDNKTKLTEKGRRQAEIVAKRCAKLPIEFILCSTLERAKETAYEILKEVHKPIGYSPLFIERQRPSEMIGKLKNDPVYIKIEESVIKNFHLTDFRFSDEENFDDLKKRARKALSYLANRPEENILVVTHGFFMRIVMAYVLFGEKLTGKECNRCIRVFHMENTAVTILNYDEKKENDPWWLWTWNDHSHLG